MNSSTTNYQPKLSQCCQPTTEFERFVLAVQEENKLGFSRKLNKDKNTFIPCPISLTPWKMSTKNFSLATETAKALSSILTSLEQTPEKLIELLADFNDQNSLLYHFKQILLRQKFDNVKIAAQNLNLSRFDFMLNSNQQWKLIESNTIAAGMGPFSEKLGRLYSDLMPQKKRDLLVSPSIETQASVMYQAAASNRGKTLPVIIFVVEENEDNIHDQNFLISALEAKGAKVTRLTLNELSTRLTANGQYLQLDSSDVVDLIYYRTGYNIEDYYTENLKDAKTLIRFRVWTEQHHVIVSPSIAHQISSSKWVQAKLSSYSKEAIYSSFNLSAQQSELAYQSLNSRFLSLDNFDQVNHALASGKWLLKSQGEGGGNIRTKIERDEKFDDYKESSILMEKIQSISRDNVCRMNKQKLECGLTATSELGIFVFGDNHRYGGYLARSKPSNEIEAGIHSGDGFVDLISLRSINDHTKTTHLEINR